MPTASGHPSFDDLVAFFTTDPPPNPMALSRNYPAFIAGLIDLRDRLEALEAGQLTNAHRCSLLEDRVTKAEAVVASLETTRTAANERLDKLEKQPALDAERLDALETRVRTVEGAVGHANLPDDGKTKPAAVVEPKSAAQTDPLVHDPKVFDPNKP